MSTETQKAANEFSRENYSAGTLPELKFIENYSVNGRVLNFIGDPYPPYRSNYKRMIMLLNKGIIAASHPQSAEPKEQTGKDKFIKLMVGIAESEAESVLEDGLQSVNQYDLDQMEEEIQSGKSPFSAPANQTSTPMEVERKSNVEILFDIFQPDARELKDLRVAVALNPSVQLIVNAMNQAKKQVSNTYISKLDEAVELLLLLHGYCHANTTKYDAGQKLFEDVQKFLRATRK